MTHVPPEEHAGPRAPETASKTDPSRYPDSQDDTGAGPDRGVAAGTPRWASVLGICIAVIVILVIVVLHLTGTVGPGAH